VEELRETACQDASSSKMSKGKKKEDEAMPLRFCEVWEAGACEVIYKIRDEKGTVDYMLMVWKEWGGHWENTGKMPEQTDAIM
jgi:hypothetical protein